MGFGSNVFRLSGNERTIDELLASDPNSVLASLGKADAHWRRESWGAASEVAEKVLALDPGNFHALAIAATSYGYLGEWHRAYEHAKKLLLAQRPRWLFVKATIVVAAAWELLLPRTRRRYFKRLQSCDVERNADLTVQTWAGEVVAWYESSARPR